MEEHYEKIEELRRELKENIDLKIKESSKRFFKEEIKVYGIKTSTVSKIAKKYFKEIQEYKNEDIYYLCEELFKSGIMEESFVACNWSYAINSKYTEEDFYIFEGWLNNYINNWASCDTLCNHTIGKFLEKYPKYLDNIINWTNSENRWVKRGAAVSLIIPAKNGMFKSEIFEIASKLLLDKDDLVQKGYGWMLKSLASYYEEDVYKFVLKNKDIMPRTSLRYAIEKMPKELKEEAMKK